MKAWLPAASLPGGESGSTGLESTAKDLLKGLAMSRTTQDNLSQTLEKSPGTGAGCEAGGLGQLQENPEWWRTQRAPHNQEWYAEPLAAAVHRK